MMLICRRTWGIVCAAAILVLAGSAFAETAKLTVQSTPPGAIVYLNGKRLDVKTPVRLNVRPGRHELRLELAGYQPVARAVEVYSGVGFASFDLKPAPGGSPALPPTRPQPAASPRKAPPKAPPVQAPERTEKNPAPVASTRKETPVADPVKVIEKGNSSPERRVGPDGVTVYNILPENDPFLKWIEKNGEAGPEPVPEPLESEEEETEARDVFPLVVRDTGEEGRRRVKQAEAEMGGNIPELSEDEIYGEDDGPLTDEDFEVEGNEEDDAEDEEELYIEEDESPAADDESAGGTVGSWKQALAIKTGSLLDHARQAFSSEGQETASVIDPESLATEDPDPRAEGGQPKLPVSPADPHWPDSAERILFNSASGLPHFPGRFNVLLLGLDRRDRRGILATGAEIPIDVLRKKPANSDVIMVIQFDFVDRQVRMVSIPRDTKVYIPRRGRRKINAAYAYGREKLTEQVVEDFFDIEIHRTAVVDWRGAKKCISLFKGLGLDYNGFSEKEMFWHLRKRSFARGDFRRIERQQKFMRYAMGEALRIYNESREGSGASSLVKRNLVDMALATALTEVETTLSKEEILLLGYAFRNYDVRETALAQVTGQGRLEGKDDDSSGVYFFNAYRNHSFDDIVAKVSKQEKD